LSLCKPGLSLVIPHASLRAKTHRLLKSKMTYHFDRMDLQPTTNEPLLLGFTPDQIIPDKVSMKNRRFTPFPFSDQKATTRERVGVPGGELYPYDGSVLLRFAGTGMKEALISQLFKWHMLVYLVVVVFFQIFGRNKTLEGNSALVIYHLLIFASL
jgi:hypothetical protein